MFVPCTSMLLVQAAECHFVLMDNDSTLNVCPLVTAIALGFSLADFEASTQIDKAFNGTRRIVMGILTAHVMIGLVRYSIIF